MQSEIHPEYKEVKATCSCGNTFSVKSTLTEDLSLDICSDCHPFYTGKQKLVDTGGRVERFEKRFGKKSKTPAKEADSPNVTTEDVVESSTEEVSQEEVIVEPSELSTEAPTDDNNLEDPVEETS